MFFEICITNFLHCSTSRHHESGLNRVLSLDDMTEGSDMSQDQLSMRHPTQTKRKHILPFVQKLSRWVRSRIRFHPLSQLRFADGFENMLIYLQLSRWRQERGPYQMVRWRQLVHCTGWRQVRTDTDPGTVQAQQIFLFRTTTQHVRLSQKVQIVG